MTMDKWIILVAIVLAFGFGLVIGYTMGAWPG